MLLLFRATDPLKPFSTLQEYRPYNGPYTATVISYLLVVGNTVKRLIKGK